MSKLFIGPHLVRVLFDSVAEFRRKLVGMGDDLLDIAVFIDQLRRGLVAHTGNAGQVVRALALERHEVVHCSGVTP